VRRTRNKVAKEIIAIKCEYKRARRKKGGLVGQGAHEKEIASQCFSMLSICFTRIALYNTSNHA
jgi:hypothetical protein